MLRTCMIADYLRPYAQWRINRPDPCDDGRNARAAVGLIDAAAYVTELDDSAPAIVRMAAAGCFATGYFNPGAEGETLIRHWHYETVCGGPSDLLEALAGSAERAPHPARATATTVPRPREEQKTPA